MLWLPGTARTPALAPLPLRNRRVTQRPEVSTALPQLPQHSKHKTALVGWRRNHLDQVGKRGQPATVMR